MLKRPASVPKLTVSTVLLFNIPSPLISPIFIASKFLAAEAAFSACQQAVRTHGGMGYAKESDVERLWRDARLFRIAPVSEEMVLNYVAQHDLGMPRSY